MEFHRYRIYLLSCYSFRPLRRPLISCTRMARRAGQSRSATSGISCFAYLLLRSLIRDEQDSFLTIKCFAVLMVLLGAAMMYEQMKMVNVFGLLGGVAPIPEVRDGKIRSQGVFQHALTAGTFAATAIPLFFLLWKNGKAKTLAVVGIAAATVMTVTTQTSTSLLTYAAAVGAVLLWPIRKKMKTVRIGLAAAIVGLHFVMKAPVWFLIARI